MRRTLRLFDVVCIGLNAIVGSGIYLLPDDLYRALGPWSPLAFVLCALGLWPVALCYAEAASRVDRTGGPFVYASEAFGGRVGFVVGWMCFANSLFSFAAVASAAAAYMARFTPVLAVDGSIKPAALVIIAFFAALNYFGARPGALAIDAFTVGKFSVLIVMIVALALRVNLSAAPNAAALPGASIAGFAAATFMAVFAAQGFEVVPVPAGETRAAQRNVPLAVIASLLASSLLYVIVQSALAFAYPGLGEVTDTPLANAAYSVSRTLGVIVTFGALVSTLGFVSGSALGTPRYLYAAAADGHLPRSWARLHSRFGSPHRAILITAAAAMVFVIPFDYRSLIGMSNVSASVQYFATCAAVIVLRKRSAVSDKFSLRRHLVPILGCLVSLWIVTQASGEELLWASAALACGLLLRALSGLSVH
ncbi:MAG: APC family permease [Deltaproteobacteria bacterium]|nr:APC family permease [Deltaproteobacteria bacterium]